MKKLTIAAAVFAITAYSTGGASAEDKAVPPPASMTVRDCLSILAGLQQLDARKVLVNKGKPNESIDVLNYSFKGTVRDVISHDIFLLGPVQQEAAAADRRIRAEVDATKPIVAGTKDEAAQRAAHDATQADRVDEYVSRPCKVELEKIADADLKLDENDIPGTVLAAIWRIRVK